MRVAIGGDCCIIGDAVSMNVEKYIDIPEFYNASKRIVNLEQCISDGSPIGGKTTIYSSPKNENLFKSLGIDCAMLANNHIHDCGNNGILDTIDSLDSWNISWIGAGRNKKDAEKIYYITDKTVLLSYCQYGVHYLRNVQIAGDELPGVNGFSLEKVLADLEQLYEGVEAIVSIHWAAEYVALPPKEIINWSKKILEHPKCKLIVGHHPHIPLGIIRHKGKEAYISMGNLMFPNFYIDGKQQLTYPQKGDEYSVTRMQMKVPSLTYKKWQTINRQSIIVIYDTDKKTVVLRQLSEQEDDKPVTHVLEGKKKNRAVIRLNFLSFVYSCPTVIYGTISKVYMIIVYAKRKICRGLWYCFQSKFKHIY